MVRSMGFFKSVLFLYQNNEQICFTIRCNFYFIMVIFLMKIYLKSIQNMEGLPLKLKDTRILIFQQPLTGGKSNGKQTENINS